MSEEEDPVVEEMGVFLSKQLAENLYLFQYPVRPSHMYYDDIPHLSARIKPEQQTVDYHIIQLQRTSSFTATYFGAADYCQLLMQLILGCDVIVGSSGGVYGIPTLNFWIPIN